MVIKFFFSEVSHARIFQFVTMNGRYSFRGEIAELFDERKINLKTIIYASFY
jgi:hypothetical protein